MNESTEPLAVVTSSSSTQTPEAPSVSAVRGTILQHFPHLWPAVEAGLSTCATLLLANSANPVALIYMGTPSAGKTTVASMFEGAQVNGMPLVYRSDKFTTAAFVSQSANATRAELRHVDLLPRIQFKVLLTPELSPLFVGKEPELLERFAILTRVLDGQGLTTDSGSHGQRGYTGDYLFAWIGCTTPFAAQVWEIMAQLGSRLFFLVMDATADPTIEELAKLHANPVSYKERVETCRTEASAFLEDLFNFFGGVRGVHWNTSQDSEAVLLNIAKCATLLATLRTPVKKDSEPQPEAPHRANAVLYNLARGHALLSGRTHLTHEDLPMIAQVTLSSIPAGRRAVLLALANNQGQPITLGQAESAGAGSRHTVEHVFEECAQLGIGHLEKPGIGKSSYFTLYPEWVWCMKEDFVSLLLGSDLAANGG